MRKHVALFLVISLLFVSCAVEDDEMGFLYLQIEANGSRAMEMDGSSVDPSEAYWVCIFNKWNERTGSWEENGIVTFDGFSLSTLLSSGDWRVTIEGFKDESKEKLVYYGQKAFSITGNGLSLVIEVGTFFDSPTGEGEDTAILLLRPMTKDFNLGFFDGPRILYATWTLDEAVISSWTLLGGDSNWHNEKNESISIGGAFIDIPAGKGKKLVLTVKDGLGNIVAKEGWEFDCYANCRYVVKGSMTKRGEMLGIEVEVEENYPASEGVYAPIVIDKYEDIDFKYWDGFIGKKGFVVGVETGDPQTEITYVQDLSRAVDFPIVRTGLYGDSIRYGQNVDINALVVEDSETLINTGVEWALFLEDSGMTADSPVNDKLKSARVYKSVSDIRPYMFRNCVALEEVNCDGFTGESIGGYAFENCSSLTEVPTNDNLVRIGKGAFKDCSSLESYTVADSVKYIGEGAFKGCGNLSSLTFPERAERGCWYVGEDREIVYTKDLQSGNAISYLTETYVDDNWEWGELPFDWVWTEVNTGFDTILYQMEYENNYVRVYYHGHISKGLKPGEEYVFLNERVRVKVEVINDVWYVYHDGEVHGYFTRVDKE